MVDEDMTTVRVSRKTRDLIWNLAQADHGRSMAKELEVMAEEKYTQVFGQAALDAYRPAHFLNQDAQS